MTGPASQPELPVATPRGGSAWPGMVAAVAVLALFVVYPPFRIVSRHAGADESVKSAEAGGAFDAVTFAANFWETSLPGAARTAPEIGPVLAALRRDFPAAVATHARRVGLDGAAYLFVRGTGKVLAIERGRILVDCDGGVVALRTGPVFGNVVRDGSGVLDVNAFPGVTEFNALATELNRLVEERVQPRFKVAAVGNGVQFVGGAEVPAALPASGPLLTVVPVRVEVAP